MATPPRVSAINDKGIASIENHVALQENLLDLEMQLKTAKHEISKLNEQIGVLQQTLQTKQCGELQSLNDANCILNCNNNKIRRKLCVLTNGIPGDSLQAVEDTFGSQFQYIRYVLPNCNIKDLLDNINTKLVNYDLSDYCIVIQNKISVKGSIKKKKRRSKVRKPYKKIFVYYQNVRGLRTKTVTFYNSVSASSSDLVILTETFLNSSVHDAELFPPEYIVLRRDRQGDVGWGGVLLAVKSSYSVQRITNIDQLTDDKEILFATISSKNIKFLVCVVYLPPNYCDKQYLDVLSCIENAVSMYSEYQFLIVGDFNLKSCNKSVRTQFDNFLDFCKLQQCNAICNKYGCILDLVLTTLDSKSINVTSDVEPLVSIDAYHPPLEIVLALPRGNIVDNPLIPSQDLNAEWDFHKADFQGLYPDIINIDWTDLLQEKDVNLAVDILYSKLNHVISSRVPRKTIITNKYIYPTWYTKEIIHYIKLKYFNLKKWKSLGLEFNRELFKYYRSKVKELISIAFNEYIKKIENNIAHDPSSFWKYIKDKRKNRQQCKEYIYSNKVVEGQEAANAFAEHFSSIFHKNSPFLDAETAEREAVHAGFVSG
ncbi:hypothetical protein HF086_007089, partial [Spodoptera exigua]